MKFLSAFVICMNITVFAAMPVDFSEMNLDSMNGLEFDGTQLRAWKAGDFVNYSIRVGTAVEGTLTTTVKSVDASNTVLMQILDLGTSGKKTCVIYLDSTTGDSKKEICNGVEEPISSEEAPSTTILVQKEVKVTVPAGAFMALYAKVKNNDNNLISEVWMNMDLVPILGVIKYIEQSPLGVFTMELVSYKKN